MTRATIPISTGGAVPGLPCQAISRSTRPGAQPDARSSARGLRSSADGGLHRLLLCLIVFGVLAAAFPACAHAIEAERPLTQALLRIWQVQQGLPRAAIFAIRQTNDGFIWLGTQAGLYRFDGVRFTAVSDPRLAASSDFWIEDLCEDHQHRLWIATDGHGLLRLYQGSINYLRVEEGLPSNRIRCLHVDRNNRLWVGTSAGVRCLDGDQVTVANELRDLPLMDVKAFGESSTGEIWIGTDSPEITICRGNTFRTWRLRTVPPSAAVHSILGQSDGTVWVGTSAGLVRCVNDTETLIDHRDGLADDCVYSLAPAANGSIWVGTRNGLSRIRDLEIESFGTRQGLSQSTVYTLCEDREGSLWAGTKHGLNQFIDRRTIPYTVGEGLPSNDAGPVLQDQAGNIWVGTLGAGLARFDGRHFSLAVDKQSGLVSNTVLALCEGTERSLWIGTDQGLSHWKEGQIIANYRLADGLPHERVQSLTRDRHGQLWVGTAAGIVRFDHGRFVRPTGDPPVLRRSVDALIDDPDRGLLMSTGEGGIYRIADGSVTLLDNTPRISRNVDAFCRDSEGLLWTAARGGGIGLIDGERSCGITVKDGLYDDDVYGIVIDQRGRMWMACSRGIFSVERDELLKFARGQIKHVDCIPFSPTDALRTIECQSGVQPAVWTMNDGRVWFSTIRGVIVIDPARMTRRLPSPSVLVEEVRVNGKGEIPIFLTDLPPGRTNIDFRYTALSLVSPTRIAFRYQLEGFDKDWIDAGSRREAYYTNLPPGNYRFRVRATNADGNWSEANPVAFVLRPHFYQTQWFIPSMILASLLVGWLLFRLRVRQIKLQLHAVLSERSRIARELHDTLIQGFSGVTMQMQALAARLRQSPERQTLDDIIHDAGDCLREARHSVAGLRNRQGDESGLAASIAQAARQLTDAAELNLHLNLARTPVGLTPDAEYNVLRIVQEAVSNAVRHSSARRLDVLLQLTPQILTVVIKDDGQGFEVRDLEPHLPGHYGLIGMRERAAHIGCHLEIESESGHGTRVILEVPLTGATGGSNGIRAASPLGEMEVRT